MFPPVQPKTRSRYSGGSIGYPSVPGVTEAREIPKPDFRFKVQRHLGTTIIPKTFTPGAQAIDEQYVIQGRQAQSKNEWYLYRALVIMGAPEWAISYQEPWHGGRALGGQILDFVLRVGGSSTIIRVMGKYWHPTEYGSPLDTFTRYQMLSEGYRVFDITDKKLASVEEAIQEVTRLRIL